MQRTLLRGIAWAGKKPVDELVNYVTPARPAGRGCEPRDIELLPDITYVGRPLPTLTVCLIRQCAYSAGIDPAVVEIE